MVNEFFYKKVIFIIYCNQYIVGGEARALTGGGGGVYSHIRVLPN